MNTTIDMAQFIAPKSDQLNADDLIAGPRTITITRVTGNEGNAEQPVNVFFDGDDGKPFRPCKSMRRVMVHAWGADASKYAGRSMTLYRDPKVQFGGMAVGGIRISHMSHIDREMMMSLTATRAKRTPYKVMPLASTPPPAAASSGREKAEAWAANHIAGLNAADTRDALDALHTKGQAAIAKLAAGHADLHDAVQAAHAAKLVEFADDEPDADFGD